MLSIKDLDLRPVVSVSAVSNALLERYPAALDHFLEKVLESDEPEVCSITLGNC